MGATNTHTDRSDQPASELVRQLTEQTTSLVRAEVELAKAELAQKGKRAGMGAGMFGGAGLFGFYAFGALTAAAILALATAVDGWFAALIVTAVYAAVAGVLALTGRSKVQQATPAAPKRTVETVKEDVEWLKQSAKSARR
jgi:uncharacterized membrane protein YqjE